jgi:molybdate transport system substrate-binding protein
MNCFCHVFRFAGTFLIGIVCCARFAGGEITVFAAASLSDALREIAAAYEKTTGDTVRLNLGASSLLARQIKESAPADLFFSADEAKMDDLATAGLIDPATRRSLLSNSLVIVVAADSDLKLAAAQDLANAAVRRLALAEPETVPAGIYAREYLKKQGLWEAVVGKTVPTENVRAVLAAVESGNVDAGIVYKTDALSSKKVRITYEIPRDEGPRISYPLAVIKGGGNPRGASRFLAWLTSPAGKSVFAKYGFITEP